MRFQNKIVVIATSGGSIGIECARMLQGEGAKVVFLVSDKSETAGMVESDTWARSYLWIVSMTKRRWRSKYGMLCQSLEQRILW